MKFLLITSAVVALSFAQVPTRPNIEDGRYYPSDDGQYRPDNSGAYNGANDGSYHPDDSGAYRPDGSGAYKGTFDKYVHQADRFGGSGGSGGGSGGSGGVGGSGRGGVFAVGSGRPTGGALIVAVRPVKTGAAVVATGVRSGSTDGSGSLRGTIRVSGDGSASGRGYYNNNNWAIIRKEAQVAEDGYHYVYETENKILGEEQGRLANVGTQDEAMQATGYYEYTGPDNVVYRVDYTANENGFVPVAAHLPTPPPIPEAILRSLEYQRSIGEL